MNLLPSLALLWPLVNFANVNRMLLPTALVVWIIAYGLIGSVALWAILRVVLKGRSTPVAKRVNLTLAVLVVLFFSYSALGIAIYRGLMALGFTWGTSLIYIAIVALSVPVAWGVGAYRGTAPLALAFLVVAIATPGIPLVMGLASGKTLLVEDSQTLVPPARFTPNVYVFISDMYSRQDVLVRHYAFDNGPFLEELDKLRFTARRDATANYIYTMQSIASLLEQDYMPIDRATGYFNISALIDIINGRSRSVRRLRAHGYGIASATKRITRWGCMGLEDVCLDSAPASNHRETLFQLIELTPLVKVREYILGEEPNQTLNEIREGLEQLPRNRPFFVFVHTYSPHTPNLLTPSCDRNRSWTDRIHHHDTAKLRAAYVDSIRCVNKTILETARWLEVRDPGAIVVFMSDHGKGSLPDRAVPISERKTYYAERLFNLLAIRMPSACAALSGAARSPVNVMAVVFACIEGREPDLRPDRHFVDMNNPDFGEVLEVSNTSSSAN